MRPFLQQVLAFTYLFGSRIHNAGKKKLYEQDIVTLNLAERSLSITIPNAKLNILSDPRSPLLSVPLVPIRCIIY